jgi:dynein light chain LC8-type
MSEEMQGDEIDIATQSLDRFNVEKDIASCIKKEFNKKYNQTCHAVVGCSFGSFITH